MRLFYLVNTADAQSVPLELGLKLAEALPEATIAAWYGASAFPADHASQKVRVLGARSATDRAAFKKLRAMIRETRPEILHLHHAASTFMGLAAGRTARIVKTEHNDHRFLPWHQRAATWTLAPFAARVICNSDETRHSLGRLLGTALGRRAVTVYNGVDLAAVRAFPAERGDVIGTVGRLVPQKNHDTLICAFARVPGRTVLEIVGEGPERPRLEALIAATGARVRLVGALPRRAVYRRLNQWRGFVMASRFEGFCNALVEARAAGLPVIHSDIATLNEVTEGQCLRFPWNDESALTEAISSLLLMDPFPDAGFSEKYEINNALENHLRVYREILKNSKTETQKKRIPTKVN